MKKEKELPIVSVPHMGTMALIVSSLLRSLGGKVILPPNTSQKTLSLGTKYSPEAICLPYKVVLGNYIEAIEHGAEAIIMIKSPGICRLGEYSKSIQNALDDLGYKAKFIDLDLYKGKFKIMYKCIAETTGNKNLIQIIKALILMVKKVFVLDDYENTLSYYRAREIKFGDAEKAYKKGLKLLTEATSNKALKIAKKEAIKLISQTKIDKNKEVLNVDLTGEIFLVLDSFCNQNIERELGKLGVQTRRSLTLGGWFKDAIIPKMFRSGETHVDRAFKYAKPYLTRDIGGDAIEAISDVVWATEKGTDGLIHISPFTCMPEIMSQNIFPSIRKDGALPILSLIMDEQTGKAGYITRLEAFVDLMRRRKRTFEQESCNS